MTTALVIGGLFTATYLQAAPAQKDGMEILYPNRLRNVIRRGNHKVNILLFGGVGKR